MWRSPDKTRSMLWCPGTRRAAVSDTMQDLCHCQLPSKLSCKISVPALSMPPSPYFSLSTNLADIIPHMSLTLKLILWILFFFPPLQSKLQHLNLKKGNVSKKSGGIALQCLLKTSVTHPAASPDALHRRTRPRDVSLCGVTVISFCHLPVSREAKSLPDSVKMLLNYVFCLELKTATWSEAGTLVTWPKALSDLVDVLFPLTKGKQQAICSLFEWLRLTEQRIICSDILNLGS